MSRSTKRLFHKGIAPTHLGPWDDSISLRPEDMYGDDGR